jgi:RNA polymerase sigma-70 factor (ECF subfamily)
VAQTLLLSERGPLLAYINRHLPAELAASADPQDVLQDTYFEAFRRIGQFRADDATSVYRWLVTIARNRIAELLRARRTAKRGGGGASVGQGSDSLVALLEELVVYRRTPSRSAAAHEFLVAVERALGRLDDDYRQAVSLRYLDGLTPGEIARKMGRTERAVHMLCSRGLKAVRMDLRSASLFL